MDDFTQLAYDNGWVIEGFDWVHWQEGREWMLSDDPTKYDRLSDDFARKLLTALVRQERYSGGSLKYWLNQGVIQGIVSRIKGV